MPMGFWRRRMAERLDLPPRATWYDVDLALIAQLGALAIARRDRAEMAAFLQQASVYWYEAGLHDRDPPEGYGS